MRKILFSCMMFFVFGHSNVFAEPNTMQGNREIISAILDIMPKCTTKKSKIFFGIKEQFYLIVVNDTEYSGYFVAVDKQYNKLQLIPIKFDGDCNNIELVSKFFANTQYLNDLNQKNVGSKLQAGYPAYFAFIKENCIMKDLEFDSISIPSPLPIDLLVFLNEAIIREVILWERKIRGHNDR